MGCSSGGDSGSSTAENLQNNDTANVQTETTSTGGSASVELESRVVNFSIEDEDNGNFVQGIIVHAVDLEEGTVIWTFDPSGLYIPSFEYVPFPTSAGLRVRFSAIDVLMTISAANDVAQFFREYRNDPISFRSEISNDGRVTERCVVGDGNDFVTAFNGVIGAGTLFSGAVRYISGGRVFASGFTATDLNETLISTAFFAAVDSLTDVLSRDHEFCWSVVDGSVIPFIDVRDVEPDEPLSENDFLISDVIVNNGNVVVDTDSAGGGTDYPIDIFWDGLPEPDITIRTTRSEPCTRTESGGCLLGEVTREVVANPFRLIGTCFGAFLFPRQEVLYFTLRDANGVSTQPVRAEWTCSFSPF